MAEQDRKVDMDALNAGIDRVLRYDTARKAVRKPQKEVSRAEVLMRKLKMRIRGVDRQASES